MKGHLRKRAPAGATQHKTAGPYSPVIEIDAPKLVVVSGQVAVKPDIAVVNRSSMLSTGISDEGQRRSGRSRPL